MSDDLKTKVTKITSYLEHLRRIKADADTQICTNEASIEIISKSLDFLYGFSEFTRNEVKSKLENLANLALSAVFPDKTIIFKIIPNRNKKGLFYDLYVETDGFITPLNDCKGGGVLDIISLCMRISYLRIFKGSLRQILILDEPFKNIDDVRRKLAIVWLSTTAKEMKIQMIIVTHLEDLIDSADNAYIITLRNGVSCAEKTQIGKN